MLSFQFATPTHHGIEIDGYDDDDDHSTSCYALFMCLCIEFFLHKKQDFEQNPLSALYWICPIALLLGYEKDGQSKSCRWKLVRTQHN